MEMKSRRELMKLLGLAPAAAAAAGPTAFGELKNLMSAPGVEGLAIASRFAQENYNTPDESLPIYKLFGKEGLETARGLVREIDDQHEQINGVHLDADILALKSMSLVRKHSIQRDRRREQEAFLRLVRKLVNW